MAKSKPERAAESMAEKLRSAHNQVVTLLGAVSGLVERAAGTWIDWGDKDDFSVILGVPLGRGEFALFGDTQEAFAAGHLEVCRAIPAIAGLASVGGQVASSMHLAAAERLVGMLDTLFANISTCNSGEGFDVKAVIAALAIISAPDLAKDDATAEAVMREFQSWGAAAQPFDIDELHARLVMELSAALLVCDPRPPTNAELGDGVRQCRSYVRAPLCPKCGSQATVNSTRPTLRYWKCPNCGATGKQPRKSVTL